MPTTTWVGSASGSNIDLAIAVTPLSAASVLENDGTITIDGGAVTIGADIVQSPDAVISVMNDASLSLSGHVDGGTIAIESGQLNLAAMGLVHDAPGTYMHAAVDFTGPTASIGFGTTPVQFIFDAAHNELLVSDWKTPVADLHLKGVCSAADFTLGAGGTVINYTAHPPLGLMLPVA